MNGHIRADGLSGVDDLKDSHLGYIWRFRYGLSNETASLLSKLVKHADEREVSTAYENALSKHTRAYTSDSYHDRTSAVSVIFLPSRTIYEAANFSSNNKFQLMPGRQTRPRSQRLLKLAHPLPGTNLPRSYHIGRLEAQAQTSNGPTLCNFSNDSTKQAIRRTKDR